MVDFQAYYWSVMTFYVLLLVEMDLIAHFFINSFVVFNEFDFNMQNYSWTLLQPDLKFFVGNGSGRVRTPMQTLGCSKSVEEDFYMVSSDTEFFSEYCRTAF